MAKKKESSDEVLGRDPFEGLELPPEERREEPAEVLGRDPFAGMEHLSGLELEEVEIAAVEAEPVLEPAGVAPEPLVQVEAEETEPLVRVPTVDLAEHVSELRGKGVWLLHSREVDLAIEMAVAIGATHIIYKTGDRSMLFLDAARRVCDRVQQAGLVPFAWVPIYCHDPIAEAEVAIKSARMGYEGIVFDVQDQAGGKGVAAATVGQRLLEVGLDPKRLYYSSFPNIWQHLDIPYQEMSTFCRGGFMPRCYPTFQRTPHTVIAKWAYGEHERWSREWGGLPPLYPILAAYKDEQAAWRLNVQEFLEWAQALAAHAPSFYSIYRAGTTDRNLWSILAALGEAPPVPAPQPRPSEVWLAPPPEPAPAVPKPVTVPSRAEPVPTRPKAAETAPSPIYYVVTVNDTIWTICQRYGITREQFWEWNGHLWDEQWLPRDAVYMQEGWRVRVG